MIRKCLILGIWLSLGFLAQGQSVKSLSLTDAYDFLEERYPNLQNAQTLERIHEKEQEQTRLDRLPDIYLKADGRIQSQSTQLETNPDVPLPFEINQPLVFAKSYLEASYTLLDGGLNRATRSLQRTQLKSDIQSIEVERFALRQRVNQLFIGIRLLRDRARLLNISLEDLQTRKARVQANVDAGVLLESELSKVEVRELELKARQDDLQFQLEGTLATLGDLIGVELPEDLQLHFPDLPAPEAIPSLQRPEQKLFQLQRNSLMAQSDLILAARKPRLSAYAQAGGGYPNPLNILDNDFSPFAVVGAQFSWKFSDRKQNKLKREVLTLHSQQLENAEATFEFNLDSKEAQYRSSIQRLQTQINNDEKIALLQNQILKQSAAQLDEGVITSAEYLIQVNAELSARQNLLIHRTELLNTQLEFWNERGGF